MRLFLILICFLLTPVIHAATPIGAANWVASGTTNANLRGSARVNSVVVTNTIILNGTNLIDLLTSIPNTSLQNYEITLNGTPVPLGGSFDTCDQAPVDAQYVTLATSSLLAAERVLTAGTGIAIADGGANSTITVTATNVPLASNVSGTLPVSNGGTGITSAGAYGSSILSDGTNLKSFNPRKGWTDSDEHINTSGTKFGWASAAYNSGVNPATAAGDTNAWGVVQLSTGSTTNGGSIYRAGAANGVVFGGASLDITMRIRFPTLSDGTETYAAFFGPGDASSSASGQSVDGVYFVYSSESTYYGNVGKISGRTSSNSSRTDVTSDVTVQANTWYVCRAVVNNTGTQVDFYVNDALIGSSTTNIPTGTSRSFALCLYKIEKIAGTTARTLDVDLTWATVEYGAQR